MFDGIDALIFHCTVIVLYTNIYYVSCYYNDVGQFDKIKVYGLI